MSPSVLDLPWLPRPPLDYREQCIKLRDLTVGSGPGLQHLASFHLSASQCLQFSRTLRACRETGRELAPLSSFRLGVLASGTVDLLVDHVPAAAARHGVALDLVVAPYGQVMQQALDAASVINVGVCDAVLVAVDHRWLQLDTADQALTVEGRVASALDQVRAVVDGLRSHGKTPAILQTVPVPPRALFGSYDRRVPGTVRSMVDEFNRRLLDVARETGSYLLDVAALAERVGTDNWFNPVHWLAYKLAFAAEYGAIYADTLGRVLGAIRGKARKCLVLDLDNTLWGGVIGDDGLGGIKLGQGSAVGEAFLTVQQFAIELRNRGVLLAVCSKNTESVARQPFSDHPDMLLKDADIAVFQANWTDKATNLEAIAATLKIGQDALVFLDDNPAERAQVRAALPMVAVPELPDDASWFSWFLSAAGYFEAVGFSAEDGLRANSYALDARRVEVMGQSRDLGEYLASLQMSITYAPFQAADRQRVAQLINKSNQFNLTTRRYTEAEVAELERPDRNVLTLQARLRDTFGDLGIIGIIIARRAATDMAWNIDTWLMSCRVLGRRVEEAMLAKLVEELRGREARQLVGRYVPTAKNAMVEQHYPKLGFQHDPEDQAEGSSYLLDVVGYGAPTLPFKVESLYDQAGT